MSPKLWAYVALIALIGLGLWAGVNAIYDAGVKAERGRWQEAAQRAEEAARLKEQGDTRESEGARDAAAVAAQEASRDARDQTTQTIETIRYVYRTQPAPACPADPVPDRVRDALNAAYDAAAAAAGRLPAATGPGA